MGETTTIGVETTGSVGSVGTGILTEAVAELSTGPTLTDAPPEIVTPESGGDELVDVLKALGALEVSVGSDVLGIEETALDELDAPAVALEIIDAIAVEDSVTVDEAMPVDISLVPVVAIETGGVDVAVATGALVEEVDVAIGDESTDVGAAISVGKADDDTDVLSALVVPALAEAELVVVSASSVGDVVVETAVGTSLLVETAVGTSVDVVGADVGTVGASVEAEVTVEESEADDVLVAVSEVLVLVVSEFCGADDEEAESEAAAVEVATGLDEALLDDSADVDDACEDDEGAISVEEDEEMLDEGAPDVGAFVVVEVDSPDVELTDEDPAEEVCAGEEVTAVDVLVGAVG